jgi:predicted kinase
MLAKHPNTFNKPLIYILIGLPGCGKSTWIKKFLGSTKEEFVVVSSDAHVENFAKMEGKSYSDVFQKVIGQATAFSIKDFDDAIKSRKNIILDRTNLTQKSRFPFLDKAKRAGYFTFAVKFMVTPMTCLSRQKNLDRAGKHIPMNIFASMVDTFNRPDNSGSSLDKEFNGVILVRD